MKYYAAISDTGVCVKAAESLENFQFPAEWREVQDIRAHMNASGLKKLHVGLIVSFGPYDQSYHQLMSLFAE